MWLQGWITKIPLASHTAHCGPCLAPLLLEFLPLVAAGKVAIGLVSEPGMYRGIVSYILSYMSSQGMHRGIVSYRICTVYRLVFDQVVQFSDGVIKTIIIMDGTT